MKKKRQSTTGEKARRRFEEGKADQWSAGSYGYTVRLFAHAGKLKVSWQLPPERKRTKTKTLYSADSHELRRQATTTAVELAEILREGKVEEEAESPRTRTAETLTVGDVCLLYLQRTPGFTADMMNYTASEVRTWFAALPDKVRGAETTPAVETLARDLRAFQYLWGAEYVDGRQRVAPFARDRLVSELEPGDSTRLAAYEVSEGRSPRTVANEHDRLSCAFEYVIEQYSKSIGLRHNPLRGRRLDRTRARIPMYTQEEIAKLVETARVWAHEGIKWHVFVAIGISTSGRRRGSILGLTAADHDFTAGTVTWRAEFAKRDNYGRGDSVRPMTKLHRQVVEWAIKHHPNPEGPHAPLLWKRSNPSEWIHPKHLGWMVRRLEEAANVERIHGRGIHSMRRATVTLLADELGDGKAAEFVDMEVSTVREFHYKQIQQHVMQEAAGAIDARLPSIDTEEVRPDESA